MADERGPQALRPDQRRHAGAGAQLAGGGDLLRQRAHLREAALSDVNVRHGQHHRNGLEGQITLLLRHRTDAAEGTGFGMHDRTGARGIERATDGLSSRPEIT